MYSITKNGKDLDESLYTIDLENRTFSSKVHNLVLDFADYNRWSFKTADGCEFNTGYHCGFDTGSWCTFKTDSRCIFDVGHNCVFKTGSNCAFKTGSRCIFDTGSDCILLSRYTTTYRYFLDKSRYVFTKDGLIEIADKNSAILNMKHENELVRNLCKDILKGN